MKNKLKLSLIAIATIVVGNVNAQTFYSCIPEECPAEQYFNGKKCMKLCPDGYIVDSMKCCKSNCNVSFRSIDSAIYVNGKYQYGKDVDCYGTHCFYDYNLNLQRGNCIQYQYTTNTFQWIKYQDTKDRIYGDTKTICCNECL